MSCSAYGSVDTTLHFWMSQTIHDPLRGNTKSVRGQGCTPIPTQPAADRTREDLPAGNQTLAGRAISAAHHSAAIDENEKYSGNGLVKKSLQLLSGDTDH